MSAVRSVRTTRPLRITVTVLASEGQRTESKLAKPLGPEDSQLELQGDWKLPAVEDGHPFVLVGNGDGRDEWIWFERKDGKKLVTLHRGARGTLRNPEPFPVGTPVRWGLTLQKVIRLARGFSPTPPAIPPAALPPSGGGN